MHAGDWERAEEFFAQAVEVCPSDERVRSRYAETLWNRGSKELAMEHMQEAVRLSGSEPDLVVRLGEMYLQQGDVHRANQLAQRVIRSDRESAAAHRLRGDVLRQQGSWREALAAYHRALSIQPLYPDVQMAVAEVYYRHGRPQRALSTLRSLADTYPPGEEPADLLHWQGLAFASLGRHEQAVKYLARARSEGLESADLLYSLAESYQVLGDFSAARATLQRATQVAPNHPLAAPLGELIGGGRQVASLQN